MSFKKGILTVIISASVFAYGHHLATDDFLKWLCVFLFAVSSLLILFNLEEK